MSALYLMHHTGADGSGDGVLYIGKGIVLGVDVNDIRYHGTSTLSDGRLRLDVIMSGPAGGSRLVTGATLAPGQTLQITADWSEDFANGTAQKISVGGGPVEVTFEKIGDIP